MAGIAAYFGAKTGTVAAICKGLFSRGDEAAEWAADIGDNRLEIAVRAVIPHVHAGSGGVAVVVDGLADSSTVLARYAQHGPAGVLGVRSAGAKPEPYALVLADTQRGVLVLARNGDGPSLYYARRGSEVLIASEPTALIAGGVRAAPDGEAVQTFLDQGRCETDARTFLAGVHRVLPYHVLEIGSTRVRVVTSLGELRVAPVPAATVLHQVTHESRVGIRLADDKASVALLGAALTGRDPAVAGPVPVYTTAEGRQPYLEPVLGALPGKVLRYGILPPRLSDVDELVAALSEPVPEPAALHAWCAARAAAGEVETLLDPLGADLVLAGAPAPGYLSRVADRITARFGVALRTPYRQVTGSGGTLRAELAAICRQGLTGEAAKLADRPVPPGGATLALLGALRAEVYTTLASDAFASRGWRDPSDVTRGFDELLATGRGDADWYWRLFVAERWMRWLERREAPTLPTKRPAPSVIKAEGERWVRLPVRTRRLVRGDLYADTIASYVAEQVNSAASDNRYRRLRRSWYLVVAARPLAVTQGHPRPNWDVRPSWWARQMSSFVRDRSQRGLANPQNMQLVIEEVGLSRTLLAAAAGASARLVHHRGVFDRMAGQPVKWVSSTAEDAPEWVNVAEVARHRDLEATLAELISATRSSLGNDLGANLAGCAIICGDSDGTGCRVLASTGDRPADFYAAVCADDPLGSVARTPAAVIALSPPTSPKAPGPASKAPGPASKAPGPASKAPGPTPKAPGPTPKAPGPTPKAPGRKHPG